MADDSATTVTSSSPQETASMDGRIELSIVMPCLNEADTVATCIEKAQRALADHGIVGEIIVADNGSTDASPSIAARMGARVVHVAARGYGNALMRGIEAAHGRYIIMGDADDSYDFREIPAFLTKLRAGFALVQGCRLRSGGGRLIPGAMPLLHRWIGNPLFSMMARWMFRSPVHDVYCGLRGFTKDLYERLSLRCTGMEFATEMIIKTSLHLERIAEVPITLYPDGRKSHAPHLKTFRDGWRTLRFFLLCSPRWLFLMPGLVSIVLGLMGYMLALPGVTMFGATLDAHTLLFASLAILIGYQAVVFSIFAKTFAVSVGLLPLDRSLTRLFEVFDLEKGLLIGLSGVIAGTTLLLIAVNTWRLAGFGHLEYPVTMRLVIPGATLTALGVETVLSSFFVSLLGMHRR